jgi:hypothetical protein
LTDTCRLVNSPESEAETAVTYLERARKIAYLMQYLKSELKPLKRQLGGSRGKLSDQALAQLLNAVQGRREGAVLFDAKKVNDIWNARALNLSSVEQAKILQAVQLLVVRQKLPIDLDEEFPMWLEEKYAADLPEIFRTRELRLPPGEHLGSHAESLPGAWQLFYVRPLDNEGSLNPEIRCQVAVFGRARPESTATSFLLITRQHQWRGYAILHESHVYITCTEERGADSSFIVINAPKRSDDYMFAGIALTLIQPPRRHPPLAAVVCFGQPIRSDELTEEQANAVNQAMENGRVSKPHQVVLRDFVKDIAYKGEDNKQFKADHPALAKYMEAVEINGDTKRLLLSLRVSWP